MVVGILYSGGIRRSFCQLYRAVHFMGGLLSKDRGFFVRF